MSSTFILFYFLLLFFAALKIDTRGVDKNIQRVFVDHTGNHVILAGQKQAFYLDRKTIRHIPETEEVSSANAAQLLVAVDQYCSLLFAFGLPDSAASL